MNIVETKSDWNIKTTMGVFLDLESAVVLTKLITSH